MNGQANDAVLAAASVLRGKLDPQWLSAIQTPAKTVTAIVLGSGLGSLANRIEPSLAIDFAEIPGFARSTASGHRGQLIVGQLQSAPVIAMAGRFHRYEGWTNDQVSFPIRVMQALGAKRLIASNAAGGVNPKLRVGDILVIRDHIDWLYERHRDTATARTGGVASSGLGRRGNPYDPTLAGIAMEVARQGGFTAVEGTYLATLGPTYETRAEYRMMRRIGADVVGMSTVGEVAAAAELGLPVLALSIVSNVADPDRAKVADHAEVLQAGDAAAAKLEGIVRRLVAG